MASSIKNLVDTVIALSTQAASEQITQNLVYQRMIDQSTKLVNQYHKYSNEMADYDALVKQSSSLKRKINAYKNSGANIPSDLSQELDRVKRQQKEFREREGFLHNARISLTEIYDTIHALQRTVNEIDNQIINMVYTSTRGGKMTTVILSEEDFPNGSMYGLDYDRYGKMVLRFNVAGIESYIQNLKEQENTTQIIQSTLQPKLEILYKEILRRSEIASDGKNKSPYLMWQVNNIWKKIKFSSIGDLTEAYTAALVNGEKNEIFKNILEFNGNIDEWIDTFVSTYLIEVTNKSGFFEEDINAGNGQFYGVKSAGAALMGLTLIVRFAEVIVTAANEHYVSSQTINSIQRAFNKEAKRGQIQEIIDENSQRIIKEIKSNVIKH